MRIAAISMMVSFSMLNPVVSMSITVYSRVFFMALMICLFSRSAARCSFRAAAFSRLFCERVNFSPGLAFLPR